MIYMCLLTAAAVSGHVHLVLVSWVVKLDLALSRHDKSYIPSCNADCREQYENE